MTHPDVLRQHFQAGYNALRSGKGAVQIHRLSDAEQQQSYEVNGQLYLSLVWKE